MSNFEKLGVFYLGKRFDLATRETRPDPVLYDSKDLTTHAVCVGMTGSGKTGLGVTLLEEAAIDEIPAIVIDPKGDLGNLLLNFPKLRPRDFARWLDEGEISRQGKTRDQYAATVAQSWREGLRAWGQDGKRIARLRDAVDMAIYTPGGSMGLSISLLRSLHAPAAAVVADRDAFQQRILGTIQGLLSLLGLDADPVQSRDFILLSNILDHFWRSGRDLTLPQLIHAVQSPPFGTVGVLDLETFYPQSERAKLALTLNNLLASPSFAAWREGEPLDVKNLLFTLHGKPRLSILSISHLSDSERMFFVTVLLTEVLAWMRAQPGTSSLRAILYMDEIFGYFPPLGNPPTKQPMLTLLKQARAYGLGVVLATQNPVDLDYKGLSNCGTWFLGRLQTERDKQRVLEGLEGVSVHGGQAMDRGKIEAALSALGKRVFLMRNVHDDEPVLFQTRWALSYLRGPLTGQQIRGLMAKRKAVQENNTDPTESSARAKPTESTEPQPAIRPLLPPEVSEKFLPASETGGGGRWIYRPALLGSGKLHFTRARLDLDCWKSRTFLAPLWEDPGEDVWEKARAVTWGTKELLDEADTAAEFTPLPEEAFSPKQYDRWGRDLRDYLYQTQILKIWKCKQPKLISEPGEDEADFRSRLRHQAHEERDLAVEKLKQKYVPRYASQRERIRRAEQRLSREKSQSRQSTWQGAMTFFSSILGAMLGNKVVSRTNVSKMSTSSRSLSRMAKERGDVGRAEENLEAEVEKMHALEQRFEQELERLQAKWAVDQLGIEEVEVRPRKSDIDVGTISLVWTPWQVDAAGVAAPLYA